MPGFSPTSPIVSVLLAAHDAEGSIRRALESLEAQTLANFEVVAVDAGSGDQTGRILDTMAERDLRIGVDHVEGEDLAEAFDLALERARGRYVLVMESNSWAEPGLLKGLVEVADQSALELVLGGFTVDVSFGQKTTQLAADPGDMSFPTQHDFRTAAWSLFDSGVMAPCCAKLFSRTSILERGVSFAGEGVSRHGFTLAFLRDVERVGCVAGCKYHLAQDLGADGVRNFDVSQAFSALESEYQATLELFRSWGMEGDAATMEMLQRRYVEILADCLGVVAAEGGVVPSTGELANVTSMICNDRAQLAASVARPRDGYTRAMASPIKSGNARAAYAQAKLWSVLRHGQPTYLAPDVYA